MFIPTLFSETRLLLLKCNCGYIWKWDGLNNTQIGKSSYDEMGFPFHIINLIRNCNQQMAAVRTSRGITDWFNICQGVRQGLCNIYVEQFMREAIEHIKGTI